MIKSIAGVSWIYINLDIDTEPIVLMRPTQPTSQSVNPVKDSIAAFNSEEREIYKLLLAKYKEHLVTANRTLDLI